MKNILPSYFPLHYLRALNNQFQHLFDNSGIVRLWKTLTKVVPHVPDLKSHGLPHVSISEKRIQSTSWRSEFSLFERISTGNLKISLIKYLIPSLLGEGFKLQGLVSKERHAQIKVVIPQLEGKEGYLNIDAAVSILQCFNFDCVIGETQHTCSSKCAGSRKYMLSTLEYWLMALRNTCICTMFMITQSAGKTFPMRSLNIMNVSMRKS